MFKPNSHTMRKLSLILLAFCALVSLKAPTYATTAGNGPSPEVEAESQTATIEIARLRLQNIKGGVIEGSRDGGATWEPVGHITVPVIKTNPKAYTAARYGPIGSVVATAVNAIHLKSGQNTKEDRGIIWSLAPSSNTDAGKNSLQSEVSPQSAAYTDIPGGSGIFGGVYTPFVGNPIFLDNDRNNKLTPLPNNYTPKLGDSWVIQIRRPVKYPREIIFENRFGGLITIRYPNEEPKVIGTVLRPVLGVGRFVGSYFSGVGRLCANHNGVIDISTSPVGVVGSFQIVPANHAMSPETHYIRELTQWMVVGPVSATDRSWEGTAPLFSQFLRPRYDTNDINEPVFTDSLISRFAFEVQKVGKNNWERMPTFWMLAGKPLPTWANTALADVERIRIDFPYVTENAANGPVDVPAGAPTVGDDSGTNAAKDALQLADPAPATPLDNGVAATNADIQPQK